MKNDQNDKDRSASLLDNHRARLQYVTGFFATVVAIDVIEIGVGQICDTSAITWCLYLAMILIATQTSLLSIWAGLGKIHVTWRCFAALIFIQSSCLLLPALARHWHANDPLFVPKDIFNELISIFLLIAVPLWIGRIFGVHLINIEEESPVVQQENRFQFTLRCLLEWITIAAIFMASLSYIFGKGESFALHRDWERFFVDAALNSLFAISLAWAVLGLNWRVVRIIQVLAIYTIVHVLIARDRSMGRMIHYLFPFSYLMLLPSLWFFRSIGYRLVWRNYPKTIVPTEEPAP